jgi:hypothetical protein
MRRVRALTVRQPWAALIVSGYKDVENRTWAVPAALLGQRVVIHAASRRTEPVEGVERVEHDEVRGALLGLVTLSACVMDSASAWAADECFHWVLADPVTLREPIPCRGSRLLWEVPPLIVAQLDAAEFRAA